MTRERLSQIKALHREIIYRNPSTTVDVLEVWGETIKALEEAWAEKIGQAERHLDVLTAERMANAMELEATISERDEAIMAAKELGADNEDLEQELAQLKRGEWICLKCGIRKDGESVAAEF